jgi:hypothetical protein
MNSDEIQKESPLFYAAKGFQFNTEDVLPADLASALWLKEIAYQLAVLNENHKLADPEPGKKDAKASAAELWPKIEPYGAIWAMWMHPLAEPKFFDSEEDARAYLRGMAQRLNDYVPPKKIEREMYPTPPQKHPSGPYTSTACTHGLHDRCRKSCKFCASPCMCSCHTKKAQGLEGFEPPVDPETVAHPFVRVDANRFCGTCGAGEFHLVHPSPEELKPGDTIVRSTPKVGHCPTCGFDHVLMPHSEPSSETSSTPHHQVDGLYVHAYRELYEAAKATNEAIKEVVYDVRLRRALEACTKPKTP